MDVLSKALDMASVKDLEGLVRILAPVVEDPRSFSSSESLEDSYILRAATGGHHKEISDCAFH